MKMKTQTKEKRNSCNLTRMNLLSRAMYFIRKGGFFLILGIVLGVQWRMQGLEEYREICNGRMMKTLQTAF